ncbi:hypothetical protein IWT140_02227 [Secundilactobacillus pentosiphilus]|uniref:Uncharacterized protein n=1 Tax=Secundilactobacillus pentosiphilus TaxID=1714682 RepID=A0A1Z5IS31_9LACO|nr:hypothetical protein [Secundilactobacillus pentosiphilus]GAX04585.1 hypothetical protein IWT140_02227 [Secundilactobacillus pentosiphilus]
MKNERIKYLRERVANCMKRLNSTPATEKGVLSYWFERLDDAKLNLLKYGKLALVADEVQGVTSNG